MVIRTPDLQPQTGGGGTQGWSLGEGGWVGGGGFMILDEISSRILSTTSPPVQLLIWGGVNHSGCFRPKQLETHFFDKISACVVCWELFHIYQKGISPQ